MPTYVLTSKGFVNKETGEREPFINRIYTDDNPAPMPRIDTSDSQEPLTSMADGKVYTSKAAMRESYKAGNNPKGVNYVEVGNDTDYIDPTKRQPAAPKKQDFLESIEKAEAAISRGEFEQVQ